MPTLRPDGRRLPGRRSGNWLPRWLRIAIYLRDRFECGYCARDLHDALPAEITIDHLDPVAHGNPRRPDPRRLVTACHRCNSQRQERPWTEYADSLVWGVFSRDRIRRAVRRKLNVALAAEMAGVRISPTILVRRLERHFLSSAAGKRPALETPTETQP